MKASQPTKPHRVLLTLSERNYISILETDAERWPDDFTTAPAWRPLTIPAHTLRGYVVCVSA